MMHWNTSFIRYQCILVFISVKIHFFMNALKDPVLLWTNQTRGRDFADPLCGLWGQSAEKPGEPGECSHLSDVYLQSTLEIFAYKNRAPPLADSSPWDGLLQPDKPLQSVRRRRKFQRGARTSPLRYRDARNTVQQKPTDSRKLEVLFEEFF